MRRYWAILFCLLYFGAFAQSDTPAPAAGWLTPKEELDKKRFWLLSGTLATGYTGVVIGLDRVWYSQYPRSGFHFFNDMGEWEDMDKMGHLYTAYMESKLSTQMYRWTGMDHRKAAWVGFGVSTLFQTTLETLDAFSEEWGWSWGDVAFNTSGSLLYLGQELAWKEQRIMLKYSAWRPPLDNVTLTSKDGSETMPLRQRQEALYGTNWGEILLKDYNAITIWASGNIHSFLPNEDSRFPKWLNVAVGYGANNVYGGFRNAWENEDSAAEYEIPRGIGHDRYRQFYLSLDVDLTRIPTRSKFLKTLFSVVNILKVPAPALEYNTQGNFKFHPVFF